MNNPIDNLRFSVLEYIYHHPYISFSELSEKFSHAIDLADIVISFDLDKCISLRVASRKEEDKGYETGSLKQDSHLITLPAGNAIIEEAHRRTEEINQRIQPLKDIAEKMQQQIDASNDASNAAKRQSRISIFVALLSLGVAIMAWLIPPAAVFPALASLFSYLSGK